MPENKTIFIHIGIPKTASTFLQQKVFSEIPGIQLITLPDTQLDKAFGMLQYADDSIYNASFVKNAIEKRFLPDSKKILISDEGFSGRLKNLNCINRSLIANRLKQIFPDAQILIFLRGQESMLWAHYSQSIKNTLEIKRIGEYYRHPDFANFLNIYSSKNKYQKIGYYSHAGHCSPECFRYYELIHLYKSLFEKVEVILYEDLIKNPNSIKNKLEVFFNELLSEKTNDSEKRINQGIYGDKLNKKWFANKTYFLLRKKWMRNFVYFFYKKRVDHFMKLEKEFIHSVATTFYKEDNLKILKQYPEIGLSQYPDKYRT
ncbi:MAG: hypothetical protein V2A54_06665 [Bacteroidota bacterium]